MEWYDHILLVVARLMNEADVPSVFLAIMVVMGGWMMIQAQRNGTVNWGDMFKDGTGKASALRMGIIFSLILATWLVIFVAMKMPPAAFTAELLFNLFCVVMVTFAGTKSVDKLLDAVMLKWGGPRPVQPPAPAQPAQPGQPVV